MRNWIRKHKRVLLFAFGAAGLSYVCYRCLKAHYTSIQEREAQVSLLQQAELRAESKLQSHFQVVQQITDSSALPTILPHLKIQLLEQIDLSDITEKLFQGKDSPHMLTGKEKLELWETLKILSFARAFSSICSLTLLILLLRVQMNVLARHVYIDTARDISVTEPAEGRGLSTTFQKSYLAFAEFLPHEGMQLLIKDIKKAVEEILGAKTLREPCSAGDLGQMFASISRSVRKRNESNWMQYILPENMRLSNDLLSKMCMDHTGCEEEDPQLFHNNERMQSIMEETKAILNSKEFEDILLLSLAVLIEQVTMDFEDMYHERAADNIPLAKLIPHVARLAEQCFDQFDNNKFVQVLVNLPQLQTFCAMVYSAGQ